MNTEAIMAIGMTSVVIPFIVPFAKDIFANIFIASMNVMKGKPTFKVQSNFKMIVFPNGFIMPGGGNIVKVDFSNVYIKGGMNGGLYCIKKRDMKNMIMSTVV